MCRESEEEEEEELTSLHIRAGDLRYFVPHLVQGGQGGGDGEEQGRRGCACLFVSKEHDLAMDGEGDPPHHCLSHFVANVLCTTTFAQRHDMRHVSICCFCPHALDHFSFGTPAVLHC